MVHIPVKRFQALHFCLLCMIVVLFVLFSCFVLLVPSPAVGLIMEEKEATLRAFLSTPKFVILNLSDFYSTQLVQWIAFPLCP